MKSWDFIYKVMKTATLISIAVVDVCQLIVSSKCIAVSFKSIFSWKMLGIITVVNVAMGAIFVFFKDAIRLETFTGEIMESVLLGFAWGIVYFLIIFKSIQAKWKALKSA